MLGIAAQRKAYFLRPALELLMIKLSGARATLMLVRQLGRGDQAIIFPVSPCLIEKNAYPISIGTTFIASWRLL
jgi:hypothetical protein